MLLPVRFPALTSENPIQEYLYGIKVFDIYKRFRARRIFALPYKKIVRKLIGVPIVARIFVALPICNFICSLFNKNICMDKSHTRILDKVFA